MPPRRVLPNPKNCSLHDLEVGANGARSRRSRDRMMLIREIEQWQADRNHRAFEVSWQFITQDARIQLRERYPTL